MKIQGGKCLLLIRIHGKFNRWAGSDPEKRFRIFIKVPELDQGGKGHE
jgi:hypothetical protein